MPCYLSLGEAHAFGDIDAYVASLLAADPPVTPLDRLAREAVQGTRTAPRGKRPEIVEAAVRRVLRETVFRYEPVLRINVTAHELLEKKQLVGALFAAHLALLAREDYKGRRADPTYPERFATLRDLVAMRAGELQVAERARAIVEERYLAGQVALFPDMAAAWDEQLRGTAAIADMAVRLAELDGVPPAALGRLTSI